MKLPSGCLKNISEITHITVQELSDYAARRKVPRPDRCLLLESTIGIPASLWAWGTAEQLKQALINYHNSKRVEV